MTTFTAHFRTEAQYALQEFEAQTPEQALELAHRYLIECPSELVFESY